MPKIVLIFFLLLNSFSGYCQNKKTITKTKQLVVDTTVEFTHFNDIQVYQYFDKDSLNAKITYSAKLDSAGRKIAELYIDYKTDKANGMGDRLTINEYNEIGKLSISTDYYYSFMRGQVQKQFFYYEDTLLKTVERFELKKRLKKGVDKGRGRPGGCIIFPEDFEEKRTWEVTDIIKYEYNDRKQKAKRYSTFSNLYHDKYLYNYDSNGRLIKKETLNQDNELQSTEEYFYFDNREEETFTWHINDWGSTKYIKYFTNNNLVEKSRIKENYKTVEKYFYNKRNKLIRFESYNNNGLLELTHLYKYSK